MGDMSAIHERPSWLLDKRRDIEQRYDRVFAADYDLRFPTIGATHRQFMGSITATLNEDSWVLDVGCGTGKYWPDIFASGARVIGVDPSAQMLQRAKEKFPFATVHQQAVQELEFAERFDAVRFLDVFELLGPEDWPLALTNLRTSLKQGGLMYFTVPDRPPAEQLEQSLLMSAQRGIPAVLGELAHGLSYEFFPTDDQILAWLGQTELTVSTSGSGDGHRHFMVVVD